MSHAVSQPSAAATAEGVEPSRPRGVWPHLRALFVLFHVAAVLVLAVPTMGGEALSRRAWQNPTVQDEFKAWSARLSSFGVELSPRALEDRLWAFARRYTSWHRWAKTPFLPYSNYVGVRQSWRMFVAPHRYPARLHVDVREPGASWRHVQIARSREYDWRGALFNHDRVRAMMFRYGWSNYRPHYVKLSRWVAARAAADFPAATHARVRLYEFRTASPDEVRSGAIPPGRYRDAIVHPLQSFRRAAP